MSRLFVGCKVKVIADYDGLTGDDAGLLVGAEGFITDGYDVWDCSDGSQIPGWEINGWAIHRTEELEPILNGHEPCESDFKESLDKLLSEVRDREAV